MDVGESEKELPMCGFVVVRYVSLKSTGMKLTVLVKWEWKSSVIWIKAMEAESSQPRFAVCINNTTYPDDLKVRTIYQVLPDESAARSNYIRVVDETGEDYLYPAELFVIIDVPAEAQKAFTQAVSR
jgi:hypothetical protein